LRLLIINPPHPAIGSRIPDDHLPPLGLLAIGGPLIDDGHDVALLDCEFGPMPMGQIIDRITAHDPDAILLGHSGSTSAHPIASEIARRAKSRVPKLKVIYGGLFPTYHWKDILTEQPEFDYCVRGEGEETCRQLLRAIAENTPLRRVNGIAYREGVRVKSTPPQSMMKNWEDYRIGWDLIDFRNYSYWGRKRAVVVQFSRGCQKMWKRFLEALIAENVDVTLVGSTRADDIVRDKDHLHLYKAAGVERFLFGMENYDEAVLKKIKKGGSTSKDRQAIQLMRQHKMLSMATWVVGFEEERDIDYWRTLKQLISYDPDQIQSVYVTPHRWTPFFREAETRYVIQSDQTKWDYKHQVLATRHIPPWRVFIWVKAIEFIVQSRPKAIWRLLTYPDAKIRHATVKDFWGETQEAEEEALVRPVRIKKNSARELKIGHQNQV